MWKKLRSNRDPRDTLFSELRKEFAPYLDAFKRFSIGLFAKYPKWSFGIMIAALLASTVLSFTYFREPRTTPAVEVTKAADEGLSRIMGLTERIGETLELKRTADSLNKIKTLNHADSVRLIETLGRLEQLISH